ncbi:MAG: glycolate oxidase subunit GlcF [Halieaceae bacterium]|nr:glycolate oxidase subunit GlcF [Halieaceae bacterium]
MHVELHPRHRNTSQGIAARELTGACVHCGICLATCPTYLDTRDERDSPRGRIYLIKNMLESGEASAATVTHLDRCLTCRNCETTCPSGMRYGELLDIGRDLLEHEAPRSRWDSFRRHALRKLLVRPRLLSTGLALARWALPVLPPRLRSKVPPRQFVRVAPTARHQRTMLALEGCVQSAATPATHAIARRLLDKLGITLQIAPSVGCCGALDQHLSAQDSAAKRARHNIDHWWPYVEQGAEAIVSSASGCGAQLKDYGRLLVDDPLYSAKAARITALARDIGEVLEEEPLEQLPVDTRIGRVAIHTPCTLRNALQQPALIHRVLTRLGFDVTRNLPDLGCCGSAGTYSLLQPDTSNRLRQSTLNALTGDHPQVIVTANIGCQLHLQSGADIRVAHWIELLDSPS